MHLPASMAHYAASSYRVSAVLPHSKIRTFACASRCAQRRCSTAHARFTLRCDFGIMHTAWRLARAPPAAPSAIISISASATLGCCGHRSSSFQRTSGRNRPGLIQVKASAQILYLIRHGLSVDNKRRRWVCIWFVVSQSGITRSWVSQANIPLRALFSA